ncbi:hypothetical protein L9F63_028400, partial [Diploptera punctata]
CVSQASASHLCSIHIIYLLMVPVSSPNRVPSSHFGWHSQNNVFIASVDTYRSKNLIFVHRCRKMSSVPQGAYATWKVRLNEGKNQVPNTSYMTSANMKEEKPSSQQSYYPNGFKNGHKKYLEQPPAKYNSKLMNSIWGLYNRYSVHNLKKVTDGEDAFAGVQKSSETQRRSHTL